MKSYFSSFTLLLFVFLLMITQAISAAPTDTATSDASVQDGLDAAYESYSSFDSFISNSIM
jgi:hypothetical protein